MRKVIAALAGVALVLGTAACAPSADGQTTDAPTQSQSVPTIDPSLVPTPSPVAVTPADPAAFLTDYGDYVFRVGSGPTWCTISPSFGLAICEQSEIATQYEPLPVPVSCDYSYGYQVQLWGAAPATGDLAFFPCSGGAFSDPTNAAVLLDGQSIAVAPFNCYVKVDTALCQNELGAWIALGPKVWHVENPTL